MCTGCNGLTTVLGPDLPRNLAVDKGVYVYLFNSTGGHIDM